MTRLIASVSINLIILYALFQVPELHAQDGDRIWEKQRGIILIGNELNDGGTHIKYDALSKTILVGGYVDCNFHGNIKGDICIARFKEDGTQLWKRALRTKHDDKLLDMYVNNNGDIIIWCVYGETDTSDEHNRKRRARQPVLACLDPMGNVKWMRAVNIKVSFGGIVPGSDGSICLIASTGGYQADGSDSVYCATFDSDGNLKKEHWSMDRPVLINKVKTLSNGEFLATGHIRKTHSDDNKKLNWRDRTSDILLLKFDSELNVIKEKIIKGSGDETGVDIVMTDKGSFYVLGQCEKNAFGQGDDQKMNHDNICLIQLNAQMEKMQYKVIGTRMDDKAASLLYSKDHGVIFCGTVYRRFDDDRSQYAGFSKNIFFARVKNDELDLDIQVLTGPYTDGAGAMIVTPNNYMYMTGFAESSFDYVTNQNEPSSEIILYRRNLDE